jgi:PDZ domain-containing protein
VTGHDDAILGTAPAPQPAGGSATPAVEPARRPGAHRRGRSRRVGRRQVLIGCVVLLVAAIAAASLISIPYYAITPGSAQSIAPMIGVPKSKDHHHTGTVLLVDVQFVPLKAIEWLWFELDSNAQIVPSSAFIGDQTPQNYQVEGEIDMSTAQQAATVVAFDQLGYHVSVQANGALVYAVMPGSPAAAGLAVGDRVTSVDGKPVRTNVDLARAISAAKSGDTLHVTYTGYSGHSSSTAQIRLSAWRIKGTGKQASLVCPLYGTETNYPLEHTSYPLEHTSPVTGKKVASAPCLGLEGIRTSYATGKLPFEVNLSSEGIIGPSAGLAFTLGLLQRLDPYDLTGGHAVAATGTMSIDGQIGDVGGVAQKTVAVRDSGARIFFVPPQEYKVAKAHAGGQLAVYAVKNIEQVLSILEHRYGGKLPPKR